MKKMDMYWPVALLVVSNVVYNICSKQAPENVHPLASLTVTYIVGAVISCALYFILNRSGHITQEWQHINWSTLPGIAIIGMEAAFICTRLAGPSIPGSWCAVR